MARTAATKPSDSGAGPRYCRVQYREWRTGAKLDSASTPTRMPLRPRLRTTPSEGRTPSLTSIFIWEFTGLDSPCQKEARAHPARKLGNEVVRFLSRAKRPEKPLDRLNERAFKVKHRRACRGILNEVPHQQGRRAAFPQCRVTPARQVVGPFSVPNQERGGVNLSRAVPGGKAYPGIFLQRGMRERKEVLIGVGLLDSLAMEGLVCGFQHCFRVTG